MCTKKWDLLMGKMRSGDLVECFGKANEAGEGYHCRGMQRLDYGQGTAHSSYLRTSASLDISE